MPVLGSTSVRNTRIIRGLALDTVVEHDDRKIHIINYHGVSQPGSKLDTADRLRQSHDLAGYVKSLADPVILGGDFNFSPQTEAYFILKSVFSTELVMDGGIEATVNRLYLCEGPRKQLHSDYIFMSDQLHAESFSVPNLEVSDHLPLIVTISFS
jgi:endonuclease/exonuclease/phosphatase family metal-dependent hydrolase